MAHTNKQGRKGTGAATGAPARKERKEAPNSRPPIERMIRLVARLQVGKYPNCQTLAREMEVSSKTIQRDIEFLRDRLEHPIQYDSRRFGYYYTGPAPEFPTIDVTQGELFAVLIARKALENFRGTHWEAKMASAFEKIAASLPERVSVSLGALDAAISIRPFGAAEPALDVFEPVTRAVTESEEIAFRYRKIRQAEDKTPRKEETRRLQPLHLAYIENRWQLIGFDLDRKAIRTFAVIRMSAVELTGKKFAPPATFDAARHLAGTFGIVAGRAGEEYRVRIRFDAFAGQMVSERKWHPTQEIRLLENEALELSLTVTSLEEIKRWVLGWGGHAQVLEPPELIEKVCTSARAALAKYG